MANPKRIANLQDPILFSDLRDQEAAERRRLDDRRRLLRDISAPGKDGTPRKRSLTQEETDELKEIDQKLVTDDVVDPLFKAVQEGLSLDVADHKKGLFKSQQAVEVVHNITLNPAPEDWRTVIELAGLKKFDTQDQLANTLPEVLKFGSATDLLQKLFDIFDENVGGLSPRPTKKQLRVISDAIRKIRTDNPAYPELVKDFLSRLADAVDLLFVTGAESLIDWLMAIDKKVPPATLDPNLTQGEKNLAAVYGLLSYDREKPPPYRVTTEPADSTERRRIRQFGKALFAAQGEYATNKELFDAVLPIMIKIGERGPYDEVKAIEWAQVVRFLLDHDVKASEPQLGRRVDEALNNVQNTGDNLPPSRIAIDLPDLEAEETTDHAIVADNIRALQPAYFSAMLEELKFHQVVDKLSDLAQSGVLPIGRGEAANRLFKYWREAALRISEAERRSFYARTLGIPGGDDGGMPNKEFNDLFLRFISAVSSFIRQNNVDDLLRTRFPGAISQQQVRKAGRDLAANLSLHGYGMAYPFAVEIQKQIKDIIDILSDEEIKSAFGAKDIWQVIDQVATLELGGARNSVRYRTMAASGATIFAWLANKAQELSNSGFGPILNVDEIRSATPRSNGAKATTDPNDFDLVNACEQWLAVTGTQDDLVETYAQPKEAPNMTSKPIQIPEIARETLEAVGVPAMGMGTPRNGYKY